MKGEAGVQHQRQVFDAELRDLKAKLLRMGGDVQTALRQAVSALAKGDVAQAQAVVDKDRMVNRQEHEIEELAIRLIARQQPVAGDLRQIVAALQITSDLERMGDLAVDIARTAVRLGGRTPGLPMGEIPRMAELVEQMMVDALTAYVEGSAQLAGRLAAEDDQVDHLYRGLVERLFALGAADQDTLSQAVTLAFVGRYLERIGDHATNIGESTLYMLTGERTDLN
jgi:phosphate transport system protein